MPVRDRQLLITNLVAVILGQQPLIDYKFEWFINKHSKEFFRNHFVPINKIFDSLNGNSTANQSKRTKPLECDAYFGGKYNLMFEYDEIQHFSTARLRTLEFYPSDLRLNYDREEWRRLCRMKCGLADRYRFNKKTVDFNFEGGRTCQRAYLDCFRDFLPGENGLNPTLRISELEVSDITIQSTESLRKIERLLNARLKFI